MIDDFKYPIFYKLSWAYCVIFCMSILGGLMEREFFFWEGLDRKVIFYTITFVLLTASVLCIHFFDLMRKYVEEKQQEMDNMEYQFNREKNAILNKLYKEELLCKSLQSTMKSSTPFKNSATLYADTIKAIFEEEESYLRYKPHPAKSAADIVSELKIKARDFSLLYRELLYKYETVLSIFPEISDYVDDLDTKSNNDGDLTLSSLEESYDRTKDWLTSEEYKQLSEEERNQRALDNYLKRKRSNKEVGDDYEMFVGWYFRKEGYKTEMFGLKYGLEDLGRDIIAYKDMGLFKKVLIIQCKRWSQKKEIHENVICQLYGTAVQYKLKNQSSIETGTSVIPYIVTTTPLSDTAQKFANYLGVRVKILPIGPYPRIKCNINNGNKIYHLPFDQQYKNVKIENDGEFYAYTIKEAMAKGFRRAFKWKPK